MKSITNKTPISIIRPIVVELAKSYIRDKFDTLITVVIFVDDYNFTWEMRKVQNTYQINIIKGNDIYMTLCINQEGDDLVYLHPFRVTSKIKNNERSRSSSPETESSKPPARIFSPPHGRLMHSLDLSGV
jgi:hypothetical protein